MGAYEDFLRGLKGRHTLDRYSLIDERLDFLGPKFIEGLERLSKLEDAMATTKEMQEVPFTVTLLPGQGARARSPAPFDGYVKSVVIDWPPGCNGLVDVAVFHSSRQFCPSTGFLALNAATPNFPFNEYVKDREEIIVSLQNRDAVNPHTITVVATMEAK